jgi:hypothetical protein
MERKRESMVAGIMMAGVEMSAGNEDCGMQAMQSRQQDEGNTLNDVETPFPTVCLGPNPAQPPKSVHPRRQVATQPDDGALC